MKPDEQTEEIINDLFIYNVNSNRDYSFYILFKKYLKRSTDSKIKHFFQSVILASRAVENVINIFLIG